MSIHHFPHTHDVYKVCCFQCVLISCYIVITAREWNSVVWGKSRICIWLYSNIVKLKSSSKCEVICWKLLNILKETCWLINTKTRQCILGMIFRIGNALWRHEYRARFTSSRSFKGSKKRNSCFAVSRACSSYKYFANRRSSVKYTPNHVLLFQPKAGGGTAASLYQWSISSQLVPAA